MTRLGKVLSAYVIASLATLLAGWMVTFVLASGLKLPVDPWLAIALLWLLTVGLPSMLAAANHLLKTLGVKGSLWPTLHQVNSRLVPVGAGGNFSHNLPVIPALRPERPGGAIELKQFEIRAGHYVISQPVLEQFLQTAWRRQRQYKDGLSRTWWVEQGRQLERGEYEAIITVLLREGLVAGRGQGRSGKLIMPPAAAMIHLEDRL